MQVSVVQDSPGLEALTPEWLELSRNGELVQSPLWCLPWWRAYGDSQGRQLRVVTLREGGRLVGVVPMLRRPAFLAPLVPGVRGEPLGSGEDEEEETCSDYTGMLAAPQHLPQLADALAGELARGALGDVDVIVWPGLATGSETQAQLTRALHRAGFEVEREDTAPAPYIALPARWDDYLAALDQDKRYQLKRALRELDAWGGGHHQLHLADSPASLQEGLGILRELHAARWEAAGEHGVFRAPRFVRFLEDTAALQLRDGGLELMWLTVRDRPVAALINMVWNGRVHYYQAGRAMDLPPKVKIGTALHAFAIQRAIEHRRVAYDFLAGTARYKLELATAQRPLCTLRARRAGLRTQAAAWADRNLRQAARRLRTLVQRRGNIQDP